MLQLSFSLQLPWVSSSSDDTSADPAAAAPRTGVPVRKQKPSPFATSPRASFAAALESSAAAVATGTPKAAAAAAAAAVGGSGELDGDDYSDTSPVPGRIYFYFYLLCSSHLTSNVVLAVTVKLCS